MALKCGMPLEIKVGHSFRHDLVDAPPEADLQDGEVLLEVYFLPGPSIRQTLIRTACINSQFQGKKAGDANLVGGVRTRNDWSTEDGNCRRGYE
ncbi:hypothetical protein P8C59_008304 [Phyllachora maydis]|uniref:Uncharacterized protein n=1 Tax=Phyllachora maydis TaxID=1825666 RepID=A0AAD9IBZ6_9PEZI|nr:hypothetical protein P8C59_008304 [Phyllachora maydis]